MIPVVLLSAFLAGPPGADTTGAQPLIALFTYSALGWEPIFWNSVPRFVLYQDGRVIYRTDEGGWGSEAAFETVQLSRPEALALVDSLELEPDFFRLDSAYNNMPEFYDLSTFIISVWRDQAAKVVSLTGVVAPDSSLSEAPQFRALSPPGFLELWRRLRTYRNRRATPWKPAQFEVELSVFPYANTRVQWPSRWPGIHSPGAYRDKNGGYHIPLERDQIQEFLRIYGEDAPSTGFMIEGELWTGLVRPVFPGDRYWNP